MRAWTGKIFEDQSYSHQTQWSGSARIFKGGEIKLFFTDVAFYRDAAWQHIKRTTRASRSASARCTPTSRL
jgi:hypothetical protein